MAKKFEFKFDLDEDEETWLTPQLSERTVGTQSKPVDLKEWFAQIPTSDRASLLSKKLQKYAQKRGISVVRNSMTQSLMKVEEETPATQLIAHTTANSKPVRASSVSPRPTSTFTAENRPVQPTARTVPPPQPAQSRGSTESIDQSRSLQTTATPLSSRSRASTTNRQQVRLSRPTSSLRPLTNHQRTSERPPQPATVNQSHGGSIVRVPNPKAQLLQALISTPTTNNKERDRNSNLPPSHDHVNSLNNRPVSAPRPSPQTGSDIPDLAALQELARQQEEALRQAVERQQHGNIERKHSWQNDAISRSVHSSAGSLVSSKSADMTALHRVNANPVSRIPGPTRLPRKSGIPAPAKRVATPARCASAVPQPTYDDECF
nr:CRE-FBN-1 protein [Haemonchus contortus]